MSSHVFHEIFLHFNWHTQSDLPLLQDTVGPFAHNFLQDRCRATKGVFFHAVGGTPTHVHLVVQVEPFICPSDLVGDLKGACAREVNTRLRRQALRWQRGFGVVSFAKRHLKGVIEYVARQREHHASATTRDGLERYAAEISGDA